jgi:4-hydroxy-L-threonine phosphate dehydrogenase PdxA
MSDVRTIALTIGDPNGIGPEIAVKAAARLRSSMDVRVILVGDETVIRHYGERCAASVEIHDFAADLAEDAILIHPVEVQPAARFRPGKIDSAAGHATLAYVEAAIGLIRNGAADAIVGHVPVKLLAGRNASALSVGAGVLFSSVGHGSAFDIAGQNRADPAAVLRTLRLIGNVPTNAPGSIAVGAA